jgi:CheY-like chemotaxis protein
MDEDDVDPRNLRILVVDDNHDAAVTLSMLLELRGYQTDTAHNGLDAVRAATQVRYNAVVLDLGMPVMDGFEAAADLGQLRPAPILIAYSAWDDAETRRRTTDLGFSAHLTKPVRLDVLEAALGLAREANSGCRRSHGDETQDVAYARARAETSLASCA